MPSDIGIEKDAKSKDTPGKEDEWPSLGLYNEQGQKWTQSLDRQCRSKAEIVNNHDLGELGAKKCGWLFRR